MRQQRFDAVTKPRARHQSPAVGLEDAHDHAIKRAAAQRAFQRQQQHVTQGCPRQRISRALELLQQAVTQLQHVVFARRRRGGYPFAGVERRHTHGRPRRFSELFEALTIARNVQAREQLARFVQRRRDHFAHLLPTELDLGAVPLDHRFQSHPRTIGRLILAVQRDGEIVTKRRHRRRQRHRRGRPRTYSLHHRVRHPPVTRHFGAQVGIRETQHRLGGTRLRLALVVHHGLDARVVFAEVTGDQHFAEVAEHAAQVRFLGLLQAQRVRDFACVIRGKQRLQHQLLQRRRATMEVFEQQQAAGQLTHGSRAQHHHRMRGALNRPPRPPVVHAVGRAHHTEREAVFAQHHVGQSLQRAGVIIQRRDGLDDLLRQRREIAALENPAHPRADGRFFGIGGGEGQVLDVGWHHPKYRHHVDRSCARRYTLTSPEHTPSAGSPPSRFPMPRSAAFSSRGPAAIGPYSHAVWAGDLLYCSGQTPIDPATSTLIDGDVTAQTHRVFDNLQAVVEDAGLTMDDVIKCNVYLTDMANFAAMNAAYTTRFSAPFPARTTVAVAGLPLNAQVEIELVAKRP